MKDLRIGIHARKRCRINSTEKIIEEFSELLVFFFFAMNKKYTLLLILSFVCLSYSFMLPPDLSYHVNRLHGSSLNMKFVEGILSAKGKILNKIKPFFPLIGFYTVMNLPIYGIGIGSTSSFGLGSMTDFSTLKNR